MATAPLKLWEHIDDYQQVLDWIEEHEGEIREAGGVLPPELEELLEAVEGDVEAKVERAALVVRTLLVNAKAAEEEADRLAAIARGYDRQADSLKRYLLIQLQRAGMDRVETPRAKVRRQRNGTPAVALRNPDEIPEAYQRVTVSFDSAGARRDLKEAGALPTEIGEYERGPFRVTLGEHIRIT